ncbi:MAG: group III truncated hemoglobin [Halioglobus sp.]
MASPEQNLMLTDLDSRQSIERFVDLFYDRMLTDEQLAPIFLDVAAIDLDVHLPHIKNYWCKLLLGDKAYSRHTMNIHRQLHSKRPLVAADFQRWLDTFISTVDEHFLGDKADRAKVVAATIAENMARAL